MSDRVSEEDYMESSLKKTARNPDDTDIGGHSKGGSDSIPSFTGCESSSPTYDFSKLLSLLSIHFLGEMKAGTDWPCGSGIIMASSMLP